MKAATIVVVLLSTGLLATNASAALFLDEWGISYGNWAPLVEPSLQVIYGTDDYVSGNGGFLNPGYGGQPYDVEACYLGFDTDHLYLGVVTGFTPYGLMGWNGYYYEHLAPGDLALDLTGDGEYDYAVDVSHGGAVRHDDLVWQNPSLAGRPAWGGAGDPLRVSSWTNSFEAAGFSYAEFDGRYAIEAVIDRADVDWTGDAKLHWTMGCGNDLAEVTMTVSNPVPEPATLLLFGAGLLGGGLLGVRRRRS